MRRRRKTLPLPVARWRFSDGDMSGDAAELVYRQCEHATRARVAAEHARESLATMDPADPAFETRARELRALQDIAELLRVDALQVLRSMLGHAAREMQRAAAAAGTRRQAGAPSRQACVEALLRCAAAGLQATPGNVAAKWPPGCAVPVDSRVRELMAEVAVSPPSR